MVSDSIRPDYGLLTCLMNAAVASDDGKQVLCMFEELCELGPPTLRSCMTVLGVYKAKSDWRGAVKFLDQMQVRGVEPDTLIFNQVLSLCVEEGHLSDAEKLFARWMNLQDVISCNTLVKGYCLQADMVNAERVLERMLQKGPSPSLVTFNTVMDCAVRSL